MSIDPSSARRPNPRWWPWHQRLGLGFAVVFVVVVATGLVLNHAEALKLDRITITSDRVLDWYGLFPEGEPVAFQDGPCIVEWSGSLYFDGQPLGPATGLKGVVSGASQVVVATARELWLLTPQGDLIERYPSAHLPDGEIRRLGRRSQPFLLTMETATGIYGNATDLATWDPLPSAAEIHWSERIDLPSEQREAVLRSYRGSGLTLYRVVLDLHSGRFFGAAGVWIVDAAGLVLLFLTATGVGYALRAKRR